ncbi:hypothetical protein QFZ42_005395 [Variovorax paradoxus]|jgi:hypothetical protein|uniref:hypothetical protein n=1 Tax=Variovorax paradoxus TaxID=34073 RepID=UPI00278E4A05|nr:hypothetical protein [Variovorax paradoxus]MDQ0573561.1 hypothetical protein [Variovorax paradoxus]
MRTSFKLLALGSFAVFAALGTVHASAETTDGSDYHPLQMNSSENPDVQAGAMAAARPGGTESIGQSTSAPAMNSTIPVSDVEAGAYAASHATGTESIGQSTSLPLVQSASGS